MKKQKRGRRGWVYVVRNLINDKEYVGQTVRGVLVRWSEHVYAAFSRKNQKPLYRAMRRDALENFVVKVLWHGAESKLNAAEKRFVRQRKTFIDWGMGYNLTTGGGQCKVSKKTRRKLSLAHRGVPLSDSHRWAKILAGRRPEVRAASSATHKSQMSRPKDRKAMSIRVSKTYADDPVLIEQLRASANAAYATDSTLRPRLSAVQKVVQNRSNVKSRHSATCTGRKLSKRHSKAIGQSLVGHEVSLSTRAAISRKSKGQKRTVKVCDAFSAIQKRLWKNPLLRAKQSAAHKHPWTVKRRAAYEMKLGRKVDLSG